MIGNDNLPSLAESRSLSKIETVAVLFNFPPEPITTTRTYASAYCRIYVDGKDYFRRIGTNFCSGITAHV